MKKYAVNILQLTILEIILMCSAHFAPSHMPVIFPDLAEISN